MPYNIQKGDWVRIMWNDHCQLVVQVHDPDPLFMYGKEFTALCPDDTASMRAVSYDSVVDVCNPEEQTTLLIKYGNLV